MKKIIKNITILRPGGNDTALVQGINRSQQERKIINDAIMKKFKNVEQVGFINLKNPELQMAGGEFCGNATRCATYLALKNKFGEITIKVSGVNKNLKAGIDQQGNTWAEMPVYQNLNLILRKGKYTIVPLMGITIVVIDRKIKFASQANAKKKALNILRQLKLINTIPASGVMFLYKNEENYAIEPILWVRDIKTLFYETACGSGTTAVGIYLSQKLNKNIECTPILQPSGEKINVTVLSNKSNLILAKISGSIKVFTYSAQVETEACV